MDWTLSAFTDDDYEGLVSVHGEVYPDYARTVADWRRVDTIEDPRIAWRRWIARRGDRVVGWARYGHSRFTFHPRKLRVEVGVHPDHRGLGIGQALWRTLKAGVVALDPIVLRGQLFGDAPRARRFAARCGFVEGARDQASHLCVESFEPDDFAEDMARAAARVQSYSYDELAHDPARDRKYHALVMSVATDVPSSDAQTAISFEQWHKTMFENPNVAPALHMIAVREGRYVGMSNLWRRPGAGTLEVGLTGVLRAERQRGVAMGLKVHALAAAKAQGYRTARTWNDENNRGMLSINRRLGFRPGRMVLQVNKVLDAQALAASAKGLSEA